MDDAALELITGDGGTQIRYRGRRLYPTSPISATRNRARRITPAAEALCLLASPLLGYGVEELTENLPGDSILLSVEAEPALLELSRRAGGVEARSPAEMTEWIKSLPDSWFLRFRRVQVLTLNAGYGIAPSVYRELEALIRTRLQRAWQNKMTTIHMGRLWITNLIDNLPLLSGCRDLGDLTTRRSVAVVGAAPSLDRTADALARHRDSLFVLAVDTAYTSLHDRGITPDALCVVEAQHANLDDILGTPIDGQVICADIASYSALLRMCSPENLYLFSSSFVEAALLRRLAGAGLRPMTVPPLGSVGATAVELATRLSDGPIFLFGLDFAFHHGKTHARATPQHRRLLRSRNRLTGSDPAPFTLAARTLPLRQSHGMHDSGDPVSLTTSELRTYNLVTADLCRGKESYDLGGAATPLGRKLGVDALSPILGRGAEEGARSPSRPAHELPETECGGIAPRDALEAFVEKEIAELNRFSATLRGGDWAEATAMLDRLDYLTIDFPEPGEPDRSMATRLLASASYYRGRWMRSRDRL